MSSAFNVCSACAAVFISSFSVVTSFFNAATSSFASEDTAVFSCLILSICFVRLETDVFNAFNSFSISSIELASAPKDWVQVTTQKKAVAKPPIYFFHKAFCIFFLPFLKKALIPQFKIFTQKNNTLNSATLGFASFLLLSSFFANLHYFSRYYVLMYTIQV